MRVILIDANTHGMQSMVDAIGICRNKKCTLDTIEKALKAKPVPHMSVLEFGWAMVRVEGVSIKTARQLFRHRHFSYMEESTRSVDMRRAEIIKPINFDEERFDALWPGGYVDALGGGESLEDAAYLLALGTETKFYLAGNIRSFFEMFGQRLCKKHVQDETYRLAVMMWELLQTEFPILSKAHPCKKCGKCKEA
jgi:thymidylate synthase ThyX